MQKDKDEVFQSFKDVCVWAFPWQCDLKAINHIFLVEGFL